jgi:hypothetical protein
MNRRTFIKAVGAALAAVFGPRFAAEARAEAVQEVARIDDEFTRASDALASQWTAPGPFQKSAYWESSVMTDLDGVALYSVGTGYGYTKSPDVTFSGDGGSVPGAEALIVRGNLRPVEFAFESCKTGIGNFVFDAESQKLQHGAHWITLSDGEWHFTYTDQFGNVHES